MCVCVCVCVCVHERERHVFEYVYVSESVCVCVHAHLCTYYSPASSDGKENVLVHFKTCVANEYLEHLTLTLSRI